MMYAVVFVPFLISSIHALGQCTHYGNVDIRYAEDQHVAPYAIVNDTMQCYNFFKEAKQHEVSKICEASMATLRVTPLKIIPPQLTKHPYMTMNITVDVYEKFEWLFLRIQCVHAANQQDHYCHNHKILAKSDGVVVQPCRALSLKKSNPLLPLRFGYDCFNLFDHSQYSINITIYPQNCLLNLLITAPEIGKMFPEIDKIYAGKNATIEQTVDWAPLLAVDTTESDGIWIRFSTPDGYLWREMRISIAHSFTNSQSRSIVQDFVIQYPNTGVKWENAPRGEYIVFAYVPRPDCALVCDSVADKCKICAHTWMNFTLTENKGTFHWKALRNMRDAGLYIILFLIVIVVSVTCGGCMFLVYLKQMVQTGAESVELVERPKVLLIFADDCQEHLDVVLQLASSLSRLANAQILVDQEQLANGSEKPIRWLISALSHASKVLIILSPAVPFLLCSDSVQEDSQPKKLSQRRPFPDLFTPAIDMITNEVSTTGNKKRFAILRLPYSPPVPVQLTLLGFRTFSALDDLADLTAFLHGVQGTLITHPQQYAERDRIDAAISKFHLMSASNPQWLESRLIDVTSNTASEVPNLELSATRPLPHENNLGLLEPSDSEDEHGPITADPRHQLLDLSDSDSNHGL